MTKLSSSPQSLMSLNSYILEELCAGIYFGLGLRVDNTGIVNIDGDCDQGDSFDVRGMSLKPEHLTLNYAFNYEEIKDIYYRRELLHVKIREWIAGFTEIIRSVVAPGDVLITFAYYPFNHISTNWQQRRFYKFAMNSYVAIGANSSITYNMRLTYAILRPKQISKKLGSGQLLLAA